MSMFTSNDEIVSGHLSDRSEEKSDISSADDSWSDHIDCSFSMSEHVHSTSLSCSDCCIIGFGYVSNETKADVCMYTCRIYSSRDLDTLLHKVDLNCIGRILVYIHLQQRNEICENCS